MQRDVYTAIADPTRREIIHMLSDKALNINDITEKFEISRPAVRKHVRILNECGLVSIRKEGRERYCEARLDALAEVALWVNRYRMFWNDSLDKLESLLRNENKD